LTARVLICLANFDCPRKKVRCGGESPDRWCVYPFMFCDGDNDCGNNWDELDETCGWLNIIDQADWFFEIIL